MSELIEIEGFTNQVLGWKAWLPTVDLNNATAEQIGCSKRAIRRPGPRITT